MTQEAKLQKIIEKAVENGWKPEEEGGVSWVEHCIQNEYFRQIIFSHSFAKSFFGKVTESDKCAYFNSGMGIKHWQHHLQQLVLEEQPLKYLEKYL